MIELHEMRRRCRFYGESYPLADCFSACYRTDVRASPSIVTRRVRWCHVCAAGNVVGDGRDRCAETSADSPVVRAGA